MSQNLASQAFDYDVVIAGGGMVGASLALLLNHYSRGKIKLLVVEGFKPSADQSSPRPSAYHSSFDARSTALSYGSRQILESLSLWPQLSKQLTDIASIHVSDRGHFASSLFTREQMDWPALGYVVENAWFGKVLMNQLQQQPAIDFLAPAKVKAIRHLERGVELEIEDDRKSLCRAQLVVVADGVSSGLRQQLGIVANRQDYQQTALIANVGFSKPHRNRAYERFTDQGPMALLPLADSDQREPRAALVWTLSPQEGELLGQCEPALFLSRLQQRFGHRQGEFTRVGERFCYPLQLVAATEQIRSGVVVMGNAAHALHPVAGQGFNLAMRDCVRLGSLLVTALEQRQPLGELSLLQRYVQQQQFDQQKTISFSDYLPALFSSNFPPLSLLRNLGLSTMDMMPRAKKHFIHHAAGLHDGAAIGRST